MKKEIEDLVNYAMKQPVVNDFIITDNYYFTLQDIQFLKTIEFDSTKLAKAIQGKTDNNNIFYRVEIECNCGNVEVHYLSKTGLINHIKENKPTKSHYFSAPSHLCCECERKLIENNTKNKLDYETQQKVLITTNTQIFIEKYINTKYHKYEYRTGWNEINNDFIYTDINLIIIAIKKLSYQDFLQTFYWQIVKDRKKYRANYKCQLCGNGGTLHVHHSTYENHGNEINNLNDLIVLCDKCHEKFHDIIK